MRDNYFERMQELVASDDAKKMVFTEDLKNVTILVKDQEEELQLLVAMIKRFCLQNSNLRMGGFVFGPVVMRALHRLGKSDIALSLLKDPALTAFFGQLSSYVIAMDMLYEQKHYNDVLELSTHLDNSSILSYKHPRDVVILVMASCYKLNTPESYEFALNLVKRAQESDAYLLPRAASFFAALSLEQGDPNTAFEFMSKFNTKHVVFSNLRVWALLKMNRVDDAIFMLREIVNEDTPLRGRGGIFAETISLLNEALQKCDSVEKMAESKKLLNDLKNGHHMTQDKTLREALDRPIYPVVKTEDGQQRSGFRDREFRNRDNRQRNSPQMRGVQRQGLSDLN
jgi:pentatricopeptide repeat domain-containing protein 2